MTFCKFQGMPFQPLLEVWKLGQWNLQNCHRSISVVKRARINCSWIGGRALPLFCNGKHDLAMCMETNIANIWTWCHYLILPIQCPLSLFLFSLCHSKWLGWPAGIPLFLSAFTVFYLFFCNFWNWVGSWCLELPHCFVLAEQCEKHPVIKVKTTPIISLFHRSSWRCLEEFATFLAPEAVMENTSW